MRCSKETEALVERIMSRVAEGEAEARRRYEEAQRDYDEYLLAEERDRPIPYCDTCNHEMDEFDTDGSTCRDCLRTPEARREWDPEGTL